MQHVQQIKLPFLTTSCCWDLRASLLLLPIWWVLGLDQFIWPLLAGWIFVKWLLGHRESRFPAALVVFLIMLVAFLGSATSIEEGRRYLTFLRNFGVYLGGFLTIFLVVQTHRSLRSLKKTLSTLILISIIISFSGFLSILGVDYSFNSILGSMVPENLKTGYLANILQKSFTQAEANWFLSGFVRPKGFMMFPNLLAGVILFMLPFKLLYIRFAQGAWRWGLICSFPMDAVVVLHTLSRSAWVALAAAFLMVLLVGKLPIHKIIQWTGIVAVLGILAIPLGAGDIVETRLLEKGHSNESRALNYLLVLDQTTRDARHFAFGYGTQRDIEELVQPLGSHSTYFGLLYKYGALGLCLFLVYALILLRSQLLVIKATRIRLWRYFGRAFLCSLLILLVQALFIEIDVDATFAHITWVLSGLALSLPHMARYRAAEESARLNMKRDGIPHKELPA